MTSAELKILKDMPSTGMQMRVRGAELYDLVPILTSVGVELGTSGEVDVRTNVHDDPISLSLNSGILSVFVRPTLGTEGIDIILSVNHALRASYEEDFQKALELITRGIYSLSD